MRNKGITLISLVVTIVVLLILAGITIGTVFDDNGIIKRHKKLQMQQKIQHKMNKKH